MRRGTLLVLVLSGFCLATDASAQSVEDENGCQGTTDDPCIRSGTCSIQGATWSQVVTIARSDLYDTMGWPGVCDQVHVSLVRGNCSPGGAQVDVTVDLTADSSAFVPEIIGPLSCNAPPALAVPVASLAWLALLGLSLVGCGVFATRRVQRGSAA